MGCISPFPSQAAKLGDQVADLHLYNQKLRDKWRKEEHTVGAFRRFCAPREGLGEASQDPWAVHHLPPHTQ